MSVHDVSSPGSMVVVAACRVSVSTSQVILDVTDAGIGIPEDEQQARFFEGSTARHRAIQGTGLGLHIVASIVANHDGDITFDSAQGRGTTFTVRFPRRGAN